jgi:hypothetical protein
MGGEALLMYMMPFGYRRLCTQKRSDIAPHLLFLLYALLALSRLLRSIIRPSNPLLAPLVCTRINAHIRVAAIGRYRRFAGLCLLFRGRCVGGAEALCCYEVSCYSLGECRGGNAPSASCLLNLSDAALDWPGVLE